MSIESFNDEFLFLLAIWKIVLDLDDSALKDVHLLRVAIYSIQEAATLQLSRFHIENPLIFDMLWKLFKEFNLIQTNFKEHFNRIIISKNVFLDQIVQILIYLQQLVIIRPVQPRTRTIIACNHRSRSIALIKHTNLSKMTTLIKRSHLLFFKSILKFIPYENIAFTFGDEVDLVVVWV